MSGARRIRGQAGNALPVVLGVMLVLGILAALVFTNSIRVRDATTNDRSHQRAFQAAEAGLQVARYRLNKVVPASDKCLTDQPVAPSGGSCPSTASINNGNGTSYAYSVTPVLTAGSTMCSLPSGADLANYDYRCITSVGTAGGVTQRVQSIFRSARTSGKFPVNGMVALSKFGESGTITINGDLAGNGAFKFSGSVTLANPVLLGPSGSVDPASTPNTVQAAPYTAPVDVNAFVYTGGDNRDPAKPPHNDNLSLYPLPANVTFSAGRELAATNTVGSASNPWIIPSGTYNVCDISFGNKTYIQLAAGAAVKIYIDSPARPGSGCPSGTGNFTATNTFNFLNPSNDPAKLQIEMYGGSGTAFKVSNVATFYGTIYAPASSFESTGTGAWYGGVVADQVKTSNTFTLTGAVPPSLLNGTATYDSGSWFDCVRNPPAGGAQGAGC